jgi:hypothetical protein
MAINTLNNGDSGFQARQIINALGDVALSGTNYIFVPADGTDTENAAALQAAYDVAVASSPTSTNRITIVAAPGYYDFDTTTFLMDAEYIDLVSLDGNRSIIFNSDDSAGTISITANDVFVKGVDVQTKNFTIATNLNLLKVENCKGGIRSFGGDPTEGSNPITVSGTFHNCFGQNNSFGSYGTASGTFTNCVGWNGAFGLFGTASGTFTNCSGWEFSFGSYGTASGTFTNCTGTDIAFGGDGVVATSGTFTNCIGGIGSFGGGTGTLNGKLYYCRLTSGTFKTVSGAGVTRLCIDGSDTENNQG